MIDIDEMLKEIEKSSFFSKMGEVDIQSERVILINNVEKVFINPSNKDFKGLYESTEWLPTSPTQDDPFYKKQKATKELTELRVKVNKAVLNATKTLPKGNFLYPPHDFSQAARNGICFAFRQYVNESYFHLGFRWRDIVSLYYAGHWPVGFSKEKIIVI